MDFVNSTNLKSLYRCSSLQIYEFVPPRLTELCQWKVSGQIGLREGLIGGGAGALSSITVTPPQTVTSILVLLFLLQNSKYKPIIML
jgi:hypothetical protein